jgi:ABC-type xylose transport system permease subunit/uncharacterized protein (DUF2141 family)
MSKNVDEKHDNMFKKFTAVFDTYFSSFKIVIVIAAIWIIFSYFTDGMFLSPRNLSFLFRQITILGIMSIGLTTVLATGNIDLSVGVVTGYISIFAASMSTVFFENLPEWYPALNRYVSLFGINTTISGFLSTVISLVFCIVLGAIIGFFQGSLIAYLGIPSFIVTLSTATILSGLIEFAMLGGIDPISEKTFLYLGQGYASKEFGIALAAFFVSAVFYFTLRNRKQNRIYNIQQNTLRVDLLRSSFISILITGYILYVANGYMGFQIPVLIMVLTAVLFSYILSSTRFGRYCYAVGENKDTARFSGINVRKNVLQAFILCGIVCSIAGFISASFMGGGIFGRGLASSFQVIISCFIGLVTFRNKNEVIIGAITGALVIGSVDSFMVLIDAKPFIQYMIKGVLIIIIAYIAKKKELVFRNYISNTLPPVPVLISIKELVMSIPDSFDLNAKTYPWAFKLHSELSGRSTISHIERIKGVLKNPKFLWIIIFVFSIVFYISGISHESLWCDEAYSANMTDYSFSDILRMTTLDVHPPLYYTLLKVFRIILGKSEFALRLLSVIGAVGMVCLGAGPISRLFGNRNAMIYAVITVSTPITLVMAHEARMYSLSMFTVTASALYGLLILKQNRRLDWIKYSISVLTSAYLHYYALMAVFFINMFLAIWIILKKRELLKTYIIVTSAIVLSYLPWLVFFIGQAIKVNRAFWVIPFQTSTILLSFLQNFYYKNFSPIEGAIFFIGCLALFLLVLTVVAALIKSLIKKETQNFTAIFYLTSIYISTIVTAILISITIKPILYPRYMIVCSGLLITLFSIGINSIRGKVFRTAIILLFVFLNITTIKNVYTEQFNGSFREVKRRINGSIKPGDLVITSDCHCVSPAIYYLPETSHFLHVNNIEKKWEFTFDSMRPHLLEETNINNVLKKYKSFWIINGGIGLSVDAEEILKDIPGWEKSTEEVLDYDFYSLTRFSIRKYTFTGEKNTHETGGDLILDIKNIRKRKSALVIIIHDRDFEDEPRRNYKIKIVRINNNEFRYIFRNIEYGEYAVMVLHDENNNNNWDTKSNGTPEEGYGVSNYDPLSIKGAQFMFGKIKFEFNKHEQVVEIKMNYPII